MQKISNYTLLHKPLTKDDIPFKIPELVINNKLVEQKRLIIKFFSEKGF